jgi:hypothetical protein
MNSRNLFLSQYGTKINLKEDFLKLRVEYDGVLPDRKLSTFRRAYCLHNHSAKVRSAVNED